MKISEMIKNLNKFMEEHGDVDCWYAKDDEGNGYQEVYFEPSLYYLDEEQEVHHPADVEYYDEDVEALRPICIVN